MGKSQVADLIKDLVKASNNEYASIAEDGTLGDVEEWIDTGCYLLNAQLSGDMYKGVPVNRTVMFAGKYATGKTYLVTDIAKHFQKKEKEGIVVFWDSENATSKDFFAKRGLDPDRIIHMPVNTVEDFRTQAVNMTNKLNENESGKVKALFILDSVGNLSTRKEITDIEEGKEKRDMTRASLIKGTFRAVNLKLAKHRIPLLMTNHVYSAIGCVTKDTQIRMADGTVKEIEQILEGDKVQTLFGNQEVMETYKYENADIYELKLSDNTTLNCTKDHKFLVEKEGDFNWITVNELKVNDEIITY